MQRVISGKEELYERIVRVVEDVLGEGVVGIVLFGSTVYMGRGRDIDILVVVDGEVEVREKLRLELEIAKRLRKAVGDLAFDIHVMDLNSFMQNLTPGSFLAGLALGYEVLLDRTNIEDKILKFLQEMSKERHILHNKYGTWDLSRYARITLRIKKAKMKQRHST
ncbi:DNA polymerase beta domain protein region [Pyrolobus fumarii 1A]|uniref:DNA polymerase beta domain protein region n=1 Tax=Pyrolobus fumarii (strain DSM 11204 / 1A) TaxID=694429 RepID=G0EG11_PYRF1|nr:nucleotidyltransferase domain-containing protein [Pyrolobus fumarii]AEM39112.1 DNA polymerase beta domain protein region [Pyrolobus fumarii 1A]